MINYSSDQIVNRPVQEVFAFLTDVGRYDDWTDMAGTHLVSGGPLALGAQIVSSLRLGPSTTKLTFEVSALETNRRLGWRTTAKGPLDWDAEYLCEPLGDGTTRVTSVGSIRLNGALRLLEPMMAGEVRSGEAKELVRLKELIESRS